MSDLIAHCPIESPSRNSSLYTSKGVGSKRDMLFRTSPWTARPPELITNRTSRARLTQKCGSTLTSRHGVDTSSEPVQVGLAWDEGSSDTGSSKGRRAGPARWNTRRTHSPGAPQDLREQQRGRDPALEQQRVERHLASMAARGPEAELQRRQKIGEANRGRAPWNKGRRHTPETIEKIKAATAQAMSRPDVVAKMKEFQRARPMSDTTKEKIGSALRQRWLTANAVLRQQAEELVARWAAGACDDPRAAVAAARPVAACSALVSAAWARRQDWSSRKLADEWEGNPELRERVLGRLAGSKAPTGRPVKRQVLPLMRRTMYPTTEQLQRDFLASAARQGKEAKRTREWVKLMVQLAVQEHSRVRGEDREGSPSSSSGSYSGAGSHSQPEDEGILKLLQSPQLQAAVQAYCTHCLCRGQGQVDAATTAITLPELAFIAAHVKCMLPGSQCRGGDAEVTAAAGPGRAWQQQRFKHREQYLSLLAAYEAAGVASMALPFRVTG